MVTNAFGKAERWLMNNWVFLFVFVFLLIQLNVPNMGIIMAIAAVVFTSSEAMQQGQVCHVTIDGGCKQNGLWSPQFFNGLVLAAKDYVPKPKGVIGHGTLATKCAETSNLEVLAVPGRAIVDGYLELAWCTNVRLDNKPSIYMELTDIRATKSVHIRSLAYDCQIIKEVTYDRCPSQGDPEAPEEAQADRTCHWFYPDRGWGN